MGDLDVRIRHGGGSSGNLTTLIVVVAVLAVAGGGAAALSGVIHALTDMLIWAAVVFGAAAVLIGVLAFVFRDRMQGVLMHKGDPKNHLDAIIEEKATELRKIRAIRLHLEAARIAGVEITPDMIAMAEDPELAELVVRYRIMATVPREPEDEHEVRRELP